MKRNVKKIKVTFTRLYLSTPAFTSIFHRELPQLSKSLLPQSIEMYVNHTHYGKIRQMASSFHYTVYDVWE
jgi:hypothetical protein